MIDRTDYFTMCFLHVVTSVVTIPLWGPVYLGVAVVHLVLRGAMEDLND